MFEFHGRGESGEGGRDQWKGCSRLKPGTTNSTLYTALVELLWSSLGHFRHRVR